MKKIKTIKINPIFIFTSVFIFLCIILKLLYISTGNIKVNDIKLSEFASNRDTVKKTIYAKRGTIFSKDKEVLAKNVNSYTVIAYLDPSRTKDKNKPFHVVDKEMTAEKLSSLINMSKERILELLNTKIKKCDNYNNCVSSSPYQVELGPGGRGITELLKDKIEELELPGIDFIASTKRYYPNGDFLSYTLGYAKSNESNEYAGEMGIELYYNDELTGTNGYVEYQSDIQGYQITSMPNVEKKAIPGNDIYLTIDTNIQMFAEQAITTLETADPEWATISVMDAKTGEILGVASSPSFDNNTREIKSYYDPFVSYTYEPGSTMKIFSFLAAMENGIYNGSDKYKSGKLKVDDVYIKDWNKKGWGEITYDEGFMASSNVAASNLALSLGRAKLKDFYSSLGFGEKTNIALPNENPGVVNFKYNTEVASASYGQGMSVTAIQMLQALSTIANEGTMIKPYLISKIVDSSKNEIVLENKRTEIKKIYGKESADKIISLMRGVVDGTSKMSTGTGYYIDGYDLIGKTGTAEIASPNGGYLTGSRNYIKSFAEIFPGKDPQIIIYAAASKMKSSKALKTAVKELTKNVGTYLNLYEENHIDSEKIFSVDSYINKETNKVKDILKNNNIDAIVIGDGEKIIKQYPICNSKLNINNKVFLLTNSKEYKMPNISGWSRGEVNSFASLINLDVNYTGYGYVDEYNILKNSIIDFTKPLEVKLKPKYIIEKENKKK